MVFDYPPTSNQVLNVVRICLANYLPEISAHKAGKISKPNPSGSRYEPAGDAEIASEGTGGSLSAVQLRPSDQTKIE